MARFDLRDAECALIEPVLPTMCAAGSVSGPARARRHLLTAAYRCTLGRPPGALRAPHDLRQSLPATAQAGDLGLASGADVKGLPPRSADD